MSDHLHTCEGCLKRTATRKCTGCQQVWYCDSRCQTDHWVQHIFKCNPRRPINTADYLALAVHDGGIPSDHDTREEWGFAKANLYGPSAPFKLLGIYVGLIKGCYVKPQQLHKWRVEGRLITEIKAIYEAALLADDLAECYTWFLEHQSVLEEPEVSGAEADAQLEAMERLAWIAMGNSPKTPSFVIDKHIDNLPVEQRACFSLYTLLLSSMYAGPGQAPILWVSFGFCACPTQDDEEQLCQAYIRLTNTCTFDEFSEAYTTGTLLELFTLKCVPVTGARRELLADVFYGGPKFNKPVWDLKRFVVVNGERVPLPQSVAVNYGFVNCANGDEQKLLSLLYRTFFGMQDADPLKLHAACMERCLLKFFTEEIRIKLPGSRKLFKRLLKNSFPLQGH